MLVVMIDFDSVITLFKMLVGTKECRSVDNFLALYGPSPPSTLVLVLVRPVSTHGDVSCIILLDGKINAIQSDHICMYNE